MNDKELRQMQNEELRRRDGLEDATCADPTCDGLRCNKRYHLMKNLGNMIIAGDLPADGRAHPQNSLASEQPSEHLMAPLLLTEELVEQLFKLAEKPGGCPRIDINATRKRDGARLHILMLLERPKDGGGR